MGHKYNQSVIEQQKDFKYLLYDLYDSIRLKSFLAYVKDQRNLMINNIYYHFRNFLSILWIYKKI